MAHRFAILVSIGFVLLVQSSCIGYKTYPYVAQAGDTITIGGGLDMGLGNEFMDRTNTTISLAKDGDPTYPVRNLTPYIRAIVQLYPDPRSKVWNYNQLLGAVSEGRPFETGIALDLPTDLTPGMYTLTVSSSVTFNDWKPKLQIIDDPNVLGQSNCFQDQSGYCNDITALERQPYVRVSFDPGVVVGALEVMVPLNSAIVPSIVPVNDINVISPRINFGSSGFGTTNRDHIRMFYWKPYTDRIKVLVSCPNGVASEHMFFDIVYPREGRNPINMTGASVKAYDRVGNDISNSLNHSLDLHGAVAP